MPAGSVLSVESITLGVGALAAGDGVDVRRSEFWDVRASVPDPRDPRGRRYPLAGLLAIAILATAAGMRGYAGFATWAATAPTEVLARLGIRFRRPSEKTFRSVLSPLDPADLDRRLGAYFTTVATAETVATGGLLAVALDGKTLRAARRMGAVATHLVAVFAHRARLVPASSPSPRRAMKYPACESFSAHYGRRDCWSRWMPCTPRPRPRS